MIYKSTHKDFQGEYDVELAKDVKAFVIGSFNDNDIVIRLHKSCCCNYSVSQVVRCHSYGCNCNFYKLEDYDCEYIKYRDYVNYTGDLDCSINGRAIIQFSSRYIPKEVQEDIIKRMRQLQRQNIFRSYFSVVFCLFGCFLFAMNIEFKWNFYYSPFMLLNLFTAVFIAFYDAKSSK